MIKLTVEKKINEQINAEEFAARMYTSMGSWCEVNGLLGFSTFLYNHAKEEYTHQMKLVKYLNTKGGHAIIGQIDAPVQNFNDIMDVFEQAYGHECKVSQMINDMYELADKEKDYATCNFLQWFLMEQIEEEELFKDILDKIKLAGAENLYFLDKEMKDFK